MSSPVQLFLGPAKEHSQDDHKDQQHCQHGAHKSIHESLAGSRLASVSPVPVGVCVRAPADTHTGSG